MISTANVRSSIVGVLLATVFLWIALSGPVLAQGAGRFIPERRIPPRVDTFDLNLRQTDRFSRSRNFEVVGHSYFKGPWLTPYAQQNGLGAGFNSLRVKDGIGYFAGYNTPPTLFGTIIADVSDPSDMEPLAFVPCNPGTRCPYIRLNEERRILIGTQDTSGSNPVQPPAGESAQAGITFHDVSDPADPKLLGFFLTQPNGSTHGLDIDDRYVYACANMPESATTNGSNQEVVIVDYMDPANPALVGRIHIPGQHTGEERGPTDQPLADGTEQQLWCHEIHYHMDRLYVAWRGAGAIVIDVTDRSNPSIISRLDYIPPFSGGGSAAAAHTYLPVIVNEEEHPKLGIFTDEIFSCPPGFGRIIDITEPAFPQFISNFRLPHVNDVYNHDTGRFFCPGTVQTAHMPWVDRRSPSLFYVAWYDQGLRAWDISNPFLPREVGHYFSPPYPCLGTCGGSDPNGGALRHTREPYQDPDTNLIYVTDGNGGGITVLRWTGDIPPGPPIPGAR